MTKLETNEDFYCPKCGIDDYTKQTVKKFEIFYLSGYQLYQFNCGICKFKSLVGVKDE